jgi:galactonate dehydratase
LTAFGACSISSQGRPGLPRPTGPGLGIEIDEDAVRAAARTDAFVPTGSPLWTYPDGSFAEW